MTRLRFLRTALLACALTACAFGVQAQQSDDSYYGAAQSADTNADSAQAPGRVARLAYSTGQVQFAPAGDDSWGSVDVNRPMVIGDRLLTGDDGRAVLELGDASVRLDHDSAFDFLNLDQGNVQIELSQGTLNIAVRQLDQGENFEVDTPTVAFVASSSGVYRIDDDPDGTGSMVTVFQGSGTVYGANGASRNVAAGTSYRFNDSSLASVDENSLPQADDFDRFCESRDNSYRRYADQQQQYVPSDMIGADDLAEYGSWDQEPEYGAVWYPRSVPTGWAPYRYGHWAWIEPWGWTWVDDQRWGFAPFHYGRWVYAGNRWGWIPGPVHVRPVYAPALVAFVGGSGFSLSVNLGGSHGPVGWFPLGPRDVYTPWFHASRNYFTQVNVTNIRNVYVNKTVINNYYVDYHAGRAPRYTGHDYAYRALPNAVTAVPSNVFTGSRPVHQAILHLDRNQLARAQVAVRPGAIPTQTSLGVRQASTRPQYIKGRPAFQQQVVARHAPPPRPVSFAARQKVIAAQNGSPLEPAQLDALRQHPSIGPLHSNNDRVRVVPANAAASARPAVVSPPGQPGFHNQIHPIPARVQPQPSQPGALPSSGFRHPQPTVTQPRPGSEPASPTQLRNPRPVIAPKPASDSARPAVQPQDQREQQMEQQRAAQQQRQLQMQQREQQMEQQRAAQQQRDQAAQQQRQLQMQQREQQMAQQRAAQQQREQQMAQQRAAQQQQQAEMQQQRQAEMQQRQQQMEQQRAQQQQRDQVMQQQRQMQMEQRAQEAQQRQQQMQQREQQRPQREPADSGHHKPPPSSDER